jgi:uncharacterized protein
MSGQQSSGKNLRVLVDTSVLFNALKSPGSLANKVIYFIMNHHRLVLGTCTINEVPNVLSRKAPELLFFWFSLVAHLEFELVYTPYPHEIMWKRIPYICDENDLPLLLTVVMCEPDCLLAWDNDFRNEEIEEMVMVLNPKEFFEMYVAPHGR